MIAEAGRHQAALAHVQGGAPNPERCATEGNAVGFALESISQLARKQQIDSDELADKIAAKLKPSKNGSSTLPQDLPAPVKLIAQLWMWFKNGKDAVQPLVWLVVLYVGANVGGCVQSPTQRDVEAAQLRVTMMQKYLTYMLGPPPADLAKAMGEAVK